MAFKDFNRNLSFGSTPLPARRPLGWRIGLHPGGRVYKNGWGFGKEPAQGFFEEIDRANDWPPAPFQPVGFQVGAWAEGPVGFY